MVTGLEMIQSSLERIDSDFQDGNTVEYVHIT